MRCFLQLLRKYNQKKKHNSVQLNRVYFVKILHPSIQILNIPLHTAIHYRVPYLCFNLLAQWEVFCNGSRYCKLGRIYDGSVHSYRWWGGKCSRWGGWPNIDFLKRSDLVRGVKKSYFCHTFHLKPKRVQYSQRTQLSLSQRQKIFWLKYLCFILQ